VRSFGTPAPLFVLTGGDPMRRPDLVQLVAHARNAGLPVALTPSSATAVSSRLAVCLDGPDAQIHDAFRRIRGSYDWTMRIIGDAADLGLALQINSTVGRLTTRA
jgi:AdoMet-dependent heme synthase